MEKTIDTQLERDATALEAFNLRLGWVLHRRMEQELEAFGLTMPQYMALGCILRSSEGCTMSELATSSNQQGATMTGIIDRLVDRGLVGRERDPRDRRTLRVTLTPAGRDLLQKANARRHEWMAQVLAPLSESERGTMLAMARRYLELVEQAAAWPPAV